MIDKNCGFVRAATLFYPLLNPLGYETSLVQIIESCIDLDRLAFIALGPQFFAEPVRVALNQPVGGIQYSLRGAVVCSRRTVATSAKSSVMMDIFNLRATPAMMD